MTSPTAVMADALPLAPALGAVVAAAAAAVELSAASLRPSAMEAHAGSVGRFHCTVFVPLMK